MSRKFVGQFEPVEFHLNQMQGEQELVDVELTVLVDVGELPDASEDRIGKLRLLQLLLSREAADGSVDIGLDSSEGVDALQIPRHPNLFVVAPDVDALGATMGERSSLRKI